MKPAFIRRTDALHVVNSRATRSCTTHARAESIVLGNLEAGKLDEGFRHARSPVLGTVASSEKCFAYGFSGRAGRDPRQSRLGPAIRAAQSTLPGRGRTLGLRPRSPERPRLRSVARAVHFCEHDHGKSPSAPRAGTATSCAGRSRGSPNGVGARNTVAIR